MTAGTRVGISKKKGRGSNSTEAPSFFNFHFLVSGVTKSGCHHSFDLHLLETVHGHDRCKKLAFTPLVHDGAVIARIAKQLGITDDSPAAPVLGKNPV